MKLTRGPVPNSIDDARFLPVLHELQRQHCDEYEMVHDGSCRSEEFPSDMERRHKQELATLRMDRESMGIMEWCRRYGELVDADAQKLC